MHPTGDFIETDWHIWNKQPGARLVCVCSVHHTKEFKLCNNLHTRQNVTMQEPFSKYIQQTCWRPRTSHFHKTLIQKKNHTLANCAHLWLRLMRLYYCALCHY